MPFASPRRLSRPCGPGRTNSMTYAIEAAIMFSDKPGDHMNDLAIHTIGDELEASAAFCRSEGIGIEVTDFAFPANLDGDMVGRIARIARAVEGIKPVICHGPFYDLVVTSLDPAIVEVARLRHRAALAASREVGAGILYRPHVFHSDDPESILFRELAGAHAGFLAAYGGRSRQAQHSDLPGEHLGTRTGHTGGPDRRRAAHPHLRAFF